MPIVGKLTQQQTLDAQKALNPRLQAFARTAEVERLNPRQKQEAFVKFLQLDVNDQVEALQGLTHRDPTIMEGIKESLVNQAGAFTGMSAPETRPLKETLPQTLPMALEQGAQAGAARLTGTFGGIVGPLAGYGMRQANKAMGLVPGKPGLVPQTGEEVLGLALPAVLETPRLAGRFLAQPAVKATKTYEEGVARSQGQGNTALADADQAAITANEKNAAKFQSDLAGHESQIRDWKLRGEQIEREHAQRVQKIMQDTSRSRAEQAQAYEESVRLRDEQRQIHNEAAQTLPEAGLTSPGPTPGQKQMFEQIGGHEPYYNKAKTLAKAASPLDPKPLIDAAHELNVELTMPAEGVQYPFRRVTGALEGFGQEGPIPLERAIETQKRLGQLMGRSRGGTEYGAMKQLWIVLDHMLDAHAQADPVAAQAISAQREAARRFMRSEAAQDWVDMWQNKPGVRDIGGHNKEVNAQSLRDQFVDWAQNDRFASKAFSPEELEHMYQTIERAPQEKLGPAPNRPTPESPEGALRDENFQYQQRMARVADSHPGAGPEERAPVAPDYSDASSPAPGPGGRWEPDVGQLKIGPYILGKTTVSEGVPLLTGQQGSMPGVGVASAASYFIAPHVVSQALLNNEGLVNQILGKMGLSGKGIVRSIVEGRQTVTPTQRAVLYGLARSLGANEDSENY